MYLLQIFHPSYSDELASINQSLVFFVGYTRGSTNSDRIRQIVKFPVRLFYWSRTARFWIRLPLMPPRLHFSSSASSVIAPTFHKPSWKHDEMALAFGLRGGSYIKKALIINIFKKINSILLYMVVKNIGYRDNILPMKSCNQIQWVNYKE